MVEPVVGIFGKLPSLGDFVQRGFRSELVNALDLLTQAALQAATSEGADRDSLLRTSHSCVIHVRPGAIDDCGFVGCMVPSCDRVGRFFPLFAGLQLPPVPADAFRQPIAWVPVELAAELCATTYGVQSDASGPDELVSRLPAPKAWAARLAASQPFSEAAESTVPAILPAQSQFVFVGPEARMSVLDRAMCSRLPHMSELLGAVVTQASHFDAYFATRSLLSWSSLAALFDGRWQYWGWEMAPAAGHGDAGDEDDDTLSPPSDGEEGSIR